MGVVVGGVGAVWGRGVGMYNSTASSDLAYCLSGFVHKQSENPATDSLACRHNWPGPTMAKLSHGARGRHELSVTAIDTSTVQCPASGSPSYLHANTYRPAWPLESGCEPVWPSGKALRW